MAGTTLRVELARGDQKKRKNQTVKTKVLFVVNFDKETTTERDIYDFLAGFDVEKVDMWRGGKNISSKNYCFVTMADEEAAADAQEALDGRYLGDRQVTVELKAGRDKMADRDRRGGGDRDRSRDRDRVRSGGGDRRDVDRDRRSSRYAPFPSREARRGRDRHDSRDRDDSRDRERGSYGRLPPKRSRERDVRRRSGGDRHRSHSY
ncbi:hypothetical protein DIPPA_12732 [Diplonema papillatum]|nr:hypothetical protein DIPPA_12732 [Diplonema papillatum]